MIRAEVEAALIASAVVALVLALGGAWLLRSARADATQAHDAALDRALEGVRLEIVAQGDEVEEALSRLAGQLESAPTDINSLLCLGGAVAAAEGPRRFATAHLSILEVIGDRQVIVTSGHWPESAGLPARPITVCDGRADFERVERAAGATFAQVACREVDLGRCRVRIRGGRGLEVARLATAAGGAPGLFLVPGMDPLVWHSGPELDVAAMRELVERRRGASARAWLGQPDSPSTWRAGALPILARDGKPVAGVAMAHDAVEIAEASARWGWRLLILGGVAALAAAAVAASLARRASRSQSRLFSALELITAGRADYLFDRDPRSEPGEMERRVSELRRDLDFERRRAAVAERVAAWRDVARHLVHEVKNPLAPIQLTLQNLSRARHQDPPRFDVMFDPSTRLIGEELERLRRLVDEFGEYARLPVPRRAPADLTALVAAVLDLYGGDPAVEIRREIDLPRLELVIDEDQLRQALQNLVANSVQAVCESAGGGLLIVRLGERDRRVVVEIEDDGPGFSAEALEQLFVPYATTRRRGTGLGLAIAQRIVIEHGGLIEAGNREGGGARVAVWLPLPERRVTPRESTVVEIS